jgi:predicted phosphodiesterase
MRFGIITDIHFTVGQDETALRENILGWQKNSTDFAVQLGDLIAGNPRKAKAELQQAKAVLDTYPGTVRHVIGNHCLAVPEEYLLMTLGMQKPYYSFTVGGYRFIVLHGMDISVLSRLETPEELEMLREFLARPGFQEYCGAVGNRQKAWLDNSLEMAGRKGEEVIILCHFPLLPETTDLKHGLLWNHSEITCAVLSSPAVKACFSGHYHHGAHAVMEGIHFIVLPSFTGREGKTGFSSGCVELEYSRMTIRNQNDKTFLELTLKR